MSSEFNDSEEPTLLAINIDGLMEQVDYHVSDPEGFSAALDLAALGFVAPWRLECGDGAIQQMWAINSTKNIAYPYVEVEVVGPNEPSDYAGMRINIDDPFISFTNQPYQNQSGLNLELHPNSLGDGTGGAEKVVVNNSLEITFHRTLRIPDDNRLHQLPASLGKFPLFNVADYAPHLSPRIVEQGGIFFPMWQREAMWVGFVVKGYDVHHRYALRAFVGGVNAVSGLPIDKTNDEEMKGERKQDYIVLPQQRWIDGICVAPGVVRQFVAMPLGAGYTVEGQITGEEKFGGLQIEVIPVYRQDLKTWFRALRAGELEPKHFTYFGKLDEQRTPREERLKPTNKLRVYPNPPSFAGPCKIADFVQKFPSKRTNLKARNPQAAYRKGRISRKGPLHSPASSGNFETAPSFPVMHSFGSQNFNGSQSSQMRLASPQFVELPVNGLIPQDTIVNVKTTDIEAMGLAAGGKLVQDIARDTNGARDWNKQASRLINIHILDPSSCERVTHMVPPPPPMDAKAYTVAKLPFYVVQEDVDNRLDGGDFGNVLSVSEMDKKVGVTTEPEFDPSKPKMCKESSITLCDCIIRPCDHQFCNVCIRKLDDAEADSGEERTWKCPTCARKVEHVAGFSAPMNLPGEEAVKVNVPVVLLKAHGGGLEFESIYTSRL